jgi:hypothetical protein
LGQFEEFNCIPGPDLSPFFLWYIRIYLVDQGFALRPFTFDVWEVGGEHDFSDADMMA